MVVSTCTATYPSWTRALSLGFVFLLGALSLGFVFIVAQLVATSAWVAANGAPVQRWWWWWWWQVDASELLFSMAVLSALVHATLNSGGGIRKGRIFALAFSFAWLLVLILCATTPSSYRRAISTTVPIQVGRGSCISIEALDEKYDMNVRGGCFRTKDGKTSQGTMFTKYYANKSQAMGGIEILRSYSEAGITEEIIPFVQKSAFTLTGVKDPHSFLGFLHAECLGMVLDQACLGSFRKCRYEDCAPRPDRCTMDEQTVLMSKVLQCLQDKCTPGQERNCSNVRNRPEDATMMVVALYQKALQYIAGSGTLGQDVIEMYCGFVEQVEAIYTRYAQLGAAALMTMNNNTLCEDWRVSSTGFNTTPSAPPQVKTAYATQPLSCDPTKEFYLQASTSEYLDASPLLACFVLYMTCLVMSFGRLNKKKKIRCQFSPVRLGSFTIGIVMSALIYIGSIHLHRGGAKSIDSAMHVTWRSLYLFISYVCAHGSLLVVAPRPPLGTSTPSTAATKKSRASFESIRITCCLSQARLRSRCCIKITSLSRFFTTQFWDATGEFFWVKLALFETIDVFFQFSSFLASATSSHVSEVTISAYVLSANLIVFPIMIVCAPRLIKSNAVVKTMMLCEVGFDKVYVCVGVLLRFSTLIEKDTTFWSQLVVHGALLLPAVMTALDIHDLLTLDYIDDKSQRSTWASDHDRGNSITGSGPTTGKRRRTSLERRIFSKADALVHHPVSSIIVKVILLLSFWLGLGLGAYTAVAVTTAYAQCHFRLGGIAACATQKFYFGNGFFGNTTCTFERVEALVCDSTLHVTSLPDAEAEYATMKALHLINLTGSSLERAPSGWARVPSTGQKKGFSIDLSDSAAFSGLPFSLCAATANLTQLNLEGTPASTKLDWTGSLNLNGSAFTIDSLNVGCLAQLGSVRELSLASNGLREILPENATTDPVSGTGCEIKQTIQKKTTSDLDSGLMRKLSSLVSLDLRNNSIRNFRVPPNGLLFRPILQRFALQSGNDGGFRFPINLAENDLDEIGVTGDTGKTSDAWLSLFRHSQGMARRVFALGAAWTDTDLARFARMLPGSKVKLLNLVGSAFSSTGISALATSLHTSNVTDLDLASCKLDDKALQKLASVFGNWHPVRLRLINNYFAEQGMVALAEGLQSLTRTGTKTLTYLDLSLNPRIGDRGVVALSGGLNGSSVRTLFLEQCKVGVAGVEALGTALTNSSMEVLKLGPLEKSGHAAILRMLPHTQLVRIDVRLEREIHMEISWRDIRKSYARVRNANGEPICVRNLPSQCGFGVQFDALWSGGQ
jgi:hypothetical protein